MNIAFKRIYSEFLRIGYLYGRNDNVAERIIDIEQANQDTIERYHYSNDNSVPLLTVPMFIVDMAFEENKALTPLIQYIKIRHE